MDHPDQIRRKQAMTWWNNLSVMLKINLAHTYMTRRYYASLTGREIEQLYQGGVDLGHIIEETDAHQPSHETNEHLEQS